MGKIGDALARIGEAASHGLLRFSPTVLLGIALVLGLGFRVAVVCSQPLDDHEAHYLAEARAVVQLGGIEGMRGSVHGWLPALGYAALLERFPEISTRELRGVQTVWSAMAILLVFAIGRVAANARTGASAALVLALTPEAVWYGGSLEPYSSHMVSVLAVLLSYVTLLRKPPVPLWAGALAVTAALSLYHHPVSLVYLGAFAAHALASKTDRVPRAWALGALALAALVAMPGWVNGDPGKIQDLLQARLPDFFGRPLVMGVVFLALWDTCRNRFEPIFHALLPWAYLLPLMVFLPYFREQYLLPGAALWAWVLAATLLGRDRPRLAGLCCLHLAVADAGLLLQVTG